MLTWPIACLSLVVGFGVADLTGVRPLGGAVLAIAAGWCALQWRLRVGVPRAVALVALYLAAFVGSHVLADAMGAWAAVFTVAALVAAVVWLAADRAALNSSRVRA